MTSLNTAKTGAKDFTTTVKYDVTKAVSGNMLLALAAKSMIRFSLVYDPCLLNSRRVCQRSGRRNQLHAQFRWQTGEGNRRGRERQDHQALCPIFHSVQVHRLRCR